MAHSYHTDPKWRIAARNAKRDSKGRVLLPRIIQRAPRIGDTHPIPKQVLARMLSKLPVEMFHGLRQIEMLPRQGDAGSPFAEYSPKSKTIRMYSLPPTILFPRISPRLRCLLDITEATIEQQVNGYHVSWKDPRGMSFWFYFNVFVHELGHHHRFQYPSKTGRHGRRSEEEFMADCYCYWATVGRLSPTKYPKKAKPSAPPNDRPVKPAGKVPIEENRNR